MALWHRAGESRRKLREAELRASQAEHDLGIERAYGDRMAVEYGRVQDQVEELTDLNESLTNALHIRGRSIDWLVETHATHAADLEGRLAVAQASAEMWRASWVYSVLGEPKAIEA